MDIRHPQWRAELESTKYPFSQTATLVNSEGDVIFETTFLDASFYVVGAGAELYLSKVTVTADEVIIYVGDRVNAELATGTFNRAAPPDELRFVDQYERPAGLIVSESIRLALFSAWTTGDHEFEPEQTAFVARCCHAIPQVGLRGFELDDGNIVADDIWLVGDDGVVLTCSTVEEVNECGTEPTQVQVLRVDVIGDPLFRRRLCSQPTQFETPRFLETITFCAPGLLDSSSLSAYVSESTYLSSLNPLPPDIDVLFLGDTTASMEPYINAVRLVFAPLAAALQAELPSVTFRWAAAEYKDILEPGTFGQADWGYKINQAFTADTTAVDTAIDNWTAASTNNPDYPEEQLIAFMNIANDWTSNSRLNGRASAVKIIIYVGDQQGNTGGPYPATAVEVAEDLRDAGIRIIACNPFGVGNGIDLLNQASEIIDITGGEQLNFILSYTTAQLAELIKDAVTEATTTVEKTVVVDKVRTFTYDATESRCAKCGPGTLGDIKISVHSESAPDTILRIRPVAEGLRIEAVGERLENIVL